MSTSIELQNQCSLFWNTHKKEFIIIFFWIESVFNYNTFSITHSFLFFKTYLKKGFVNSANWQTLFLHRFLQDGCSPFLKHRCKIIYISYLIHKNLHQHKFLWNWSRFLQNQHSPFWNSSYKYIKLLHYNQVGLGTWLCKNLQKM
jgi:hypothetical protein